VAVAGIGAKWLPPLVSLAVLDAVHVALAIAWCGSTSE
jgi:hypothetical protein